MYLVGLPFSERGLHDTRGGGTPYGASHVVEHSGHGELSDAERELAQALGARVAALAACLRAPRERAPCTQPP
jgi:NAD(P)H dehydrogenase (quinone)